MGGIPSDPKVAEGWIRSKLGGKEEQIQAEVAKAMTERGISAEQAVKEVDILKHLNGFKRDPARGGELYVEGRQLKACVKEAASCAAAVGKLPSRGWGLTNKGLLSFTAEHVVIVDDRLWLGVREPAGIAQRFVSTFRGTGIQYEEYVEDAVIPFTVRTDFDYTDTEWAMIWLTAEQQGLGASRSQGYGRFEVTQWDTVRKATPEQAKRSRKATAEAAAARIAAEAEKGEGA
jgi:hypothetical protein